VECGMTEPPTSADASKNIARINCDVCFTCCVGGIMVLSFSRTFARGNAPWNFHSHSQRNVVMLLNADNNYVVDKLMVVRCYSLYVFLYSFIIVKDGRI